MMSLAGHNIALAYRKVLHTTIIKSHMTISTQFPVLKAYIVGTQSL